MPSAREVIAEFIANEVGFVSPGMPSQADDLLDWLCERGFALVERGCEHEFDFECSRCVTLDAFHPWRTFDANGES